MILRCYFDSVQGAQSDDDDDGDGDEEEEDGSSSLETDARSSRDNVLSVEDMMKFRLA